MRGKWTFAVLLIAASAAEVARGRPARQPPGHAIYHHGTGSSPITATLGADGAARIDAAAVPCASCHGADGRGKPEGGARPSDLRQAMLTKPYEVAAAGGRRRGPYDDR